MDACVSHDGGDSKETITTFSLGRLVEVNVSPLYRADIPASNGVIHVVDWILKPDDRDWCNGVILPRKK